MTEAEGALSEILESLSGWPALSPAVAPLERLLRDETSDSRAVAQAVAIDPGMTAAVLRLANSAALGLGRAVADIGQAVMVLGRDRLFELVLLASLGEQLPEHLPGYDADARGLWRHSVAVAVLSREIAGPLDQDGEALFSAGLLHDVGMLPLGPFVAGHDAELAAARAGRVPMVEHERKTLQMDHGQAGARLAKDWGLPELFEAVCRHHHEPLQAPEALRRAVGVVHLANGMAHSLGFASGVGAMAVAIDPRVVRELGLAPGALELAACAALSRIQALEELFTELGGPSEG